MPRPGKSALGIIGIFFFCIYYSFVPLLRKESFPLFLLPGGAPPGHGRAACIRMVRWHSPGSGTGVSAASNEANSQRSQSSYNKSLSNVSIETSPNAHTERNTTVLSIGWICLYMCSSIGFLSFATILISEI